MTSPASSSPPPSSPTPLGTQGGSTTEVTPISILPLVESATSTKVKEVAIHSSIIDHPPTHESSNLQSRASISPNNSNAPSNQLASHVNTLALDKGISHPQNSNHSLSIPIANGQAITIAETNVQQVLSLLKAGFNLRGNVGVKNEITIRIAQDRVNMEACADSLVHLRNNPDEVIQKCKNTFRATENLFTDPVRLRAKVQEFVNAELAKNLVDTQLLKDMGFDPTLGNLTDAAKDAAIDKMSKNLADFLYHTVNHAKEMFTDTFVKLALNPKNYSEHMCLEGGLMAFEHDLIQGLGAFPSTGQNENVTAKILNSIMEQANANISPQVLEASKKLSDATIVGGTTLVMITAPRDGVENVNQNKAITQITDNSDFLSNERVGENDRAFILDLREMMAENDTDRTRLSFEPIEPPPGCSAITRAIFERRNAAIEVSNNEIRRSPVCQKLLAIEISPETAVSPAKTVRINELSRMFQSVRMLGEFAVKAGNLPGRTLIKEYFDNNNARLDEAKIAQIQTFVGNINRAASWGMEKEFAGPSGHAEYVQFLDNPKFMEVMTALTPEEKKEFFEVAFKKGQVGEHIPNPSVILA